MLMIMATTNDYGNDFAAGLFIEVMAAAAITAHCGTRYSSVILLLLLATTCYLKTIVADVFTTTIHNSSISCC